MGKTWPKINDYARNMIAKQHMYFVATAPLSPSGHINVSPKGHATATFSIISDTQVAFLDLTGSGVETISHVKENGRIVIMFCSFDGTPCILRLWGKARVYENGTLAFSYWMGKAFHPTSPAGQGLVQHPGFSSGARSVIVADVYQVSTACGWGVPIMSYKQDREDLARWHDKMGAADIKKYQQDNNLESLDGLQGLTAADVGAKGQCSVTTSLTSWGWHAAIAIWNKLDALALMAAGAAAGAAVTAAVYRRQWISS
eukprot:gene3232-3509_t